MRKYPNRRSAPLKRPALATLGGCNRYDLPTLDRRNFVFTSLASLFLPAIANGAESPAYRIPTKRIALAIGNANYVSKFCHPVDVGCRLNSPAIDARAVGLLFQKMGYETLVKTDVGKDVLDRVLSDFAANARISKTAVFFYSGHGIQVDGTNYIVPVDAFQSENFPYDTSEIDGSCVRIAYGERTVGDALQAGVAMFNACRNNPFVSPIKKSILDKTIQIAEGFSVVDPGTDNFIFGYATKNGFFAEDGKPGALSPYAKAIVDHFATNKPIVQLFQELDSAVCDATSPADIEAKDTKCQQPTHYSGVSDLVYFRDHDDDLGEISQEPIIVDIDTADPGDVAVHKVIRAMDGVFTFGYTWIDSPESKLVERPDVIPDLPYFISKSESGIAFDVARGMGYYAPNEASSPWGLSYPILDFVCRRAQGKIIQLAKMLIETKNSKIDSMPYVSMATTSTELFSIVLVNESWDLIRRVVVEFDVLASDGDDDELSKLAYDKLHGNFEYRKELGSFDDSIVFSLEDELRPLVKDFDHFKFLDDVQKKDVILDVEGNGKLRADKVDRNRLDRPPKPVYVKFPEGFETWYKELRDELDRRAQGLEPIGPANDLTRTCVGRMTSFAKDGNSTTSLWAAKVNLYNPGVGAGVIAYDCVNEIILPVNGKENRLYEDVRITLRNDKETFRGLYILKPDKSSFHELRLTLLDQNGQVLHKSEWFKVQIYVSRQSSAAIRSELKKDG